MIYHIVSNLEDAIYTVQKYSGKRVCLLSPVGGGIFLGAQYWNILLQAVERKTSIYPDTILHCGESIGAVQLAQRVKIPMVIYTGDADITYLENDNFKILRNDTLYNQCVRDAL